MFATVIVGIDGRSQDAETLAFARQLADPGARIVAASVAVDVGAGLMSASAAYEGEYLDRANARVEAFVHEQPGVEGMAISATSVGAGLHALAEDVGADLIVVSSSRRGLVGRVFAGDNARNVLRHARCPVAIATVGCSGAGPLANVVAGYDGSPESEAALVEAVRVAARDHGRVNVVEVVEPAVAVAAMTGAYPGNAVEDEYARARHDLDQLQERFGLHGVIATGRAGHELAEAGRGADLLVIGLRNYSLLDRMIVGSVGHALLREQSAPMLIVPPAAPAEAP